MHQVGEVITFHDYDWQKGMERKLTAKVLLSNGDGSIVESKKGVHVVRKGFDGFMNHKLRDRTWEALDVWFTIFEQCLDRGDWPGIQEVDDHFGMIGNIKEVF